MRRTGLVKMVAISVIVIAAAALFGGVLAVVQNSMTAVGSTRGDIACSTAALSISSAASGSDWVNVTLHNTGQQAFSVVTVRAMANNTAVAGVLVHNLSRGEYRNVALSAGSTTHVVAIPSNCPQGRTLRETT